MNIVDIVGYLKPVSIAGLLIVIGSIIKITPLQINIWSWLARQIGNSLNRDIIDKLNTVENNQKEIEQVLIAHIAEQEEANILHDRKSILLFANDILKGELHTKEQFINALQQIDNYEKYSSTHPDFPNNRCLLAIQLIKDNYKERLAKADFLAEDYREQIYREFNKNKENGN